MSKFSVKKPLTVLVAVVVILVLGWVSYGRMTPDLMPNINLPYVVVATPYIGASPEKVEDEVTKPLEQTLATLENIDTVSSTSSENVSIIMLQFTEDANLESITVDILQKINALEGGWDDMVQTPTIMKINLDALPVTIAAVGMEGMDTTELSTFVEDVLMNKLEGINGVASVSATGLLEEEIRVEISPDKLDSLNEDIFAAIEKGFAEAEEDILETKEEMEGNLSDLESGKSALEDGKGMLDQTAGFGATLGQTQSEIASAKVLLQTEIGVLQLALDELVKGEEQLRGYVETVADLESTEAGLAGLVELLQRAEALRAQRDEYQQMTNGLTEEDLLAMAAQLAAMFPTFDEDMLELAQIEMQLAALGIALEQAGEWLEAKLLELAEVRALLQNLDMELVAQDLVRASLPAALEELQGLISTTRDGLASLQGTLASLESGSIQVNAALEELEKQKNSGIITLSETSAQMIIGEATLTQAIAQIDAGLEQLEESREQALKSADLHNIITMQMVSNLLTAQNFSMPAGYVYDGGESVLVSVGDELMSFEDLQNVVLLDLGMEDVEPIRLIDIADVYITDNADEIYANINGSTGVLLTFNKQSNYATAEVSDNVLKAFDDLAAQYEGLSFIPLMDQGDYIHLVVNAVLENLLWGAVLAVIILFLFLWDLRPTLITLVSIPVSVVFAIVLMYFSGISLNLLSLSGLAVAVGMLVDNSVVVIENIYRLRSKGISAVQAAVSGARQVSGAIAASTLTTVCIFLPIIFVEGLTKDLFTDFALTFGYALVASLVIALTVVPSMSSRLLREIKEKKHPIMDRVNVLYRRTLGWVLNKKILSMAVVLLLLVGSALLVFSRGFSFMPEMDMGQLTVSVTMPEDATFAQAVETSDRAVERIRGIEGVETVGAMMSGSGMMSVLGGGMSGLGGGSDSVNVTMYVLLDEDGNHSTSVIGDSILDLTADLDAQVSVSSSSGMDISMLGGSGVSIELYGEDLDDLRTTARAIAAKLELVDGVAEVDDGIDDTSPELHFIVDKEKAAEYNLTVAQVYAALAASLSTETTATSITWDGKGYDVLVISGEEVKLTPGYARNYVLTVTGSDGEEKKVPIRDIAEVVETETMNSIARSEGNRYVTVTATGEEGQNATLLARDIEAAMDGFELPVGMRMEYAGENETVMEAMGELVNMLLLGVLLVYLIMVAQFQSLKSPFIVMFTIPLAFTGGLFALWITGNELSVISMIGFVMLVGIIVNNGIVLVDYINQLRVEGVETREAILEAGVTRLRPILMTSITTIFGLMTMAFGMGTGAAIMQPIAIVCIGGLVYATLLTLFIVPVMYLALNRGKKLVVVRDEDLADVEE